MTYKKVTKNDWDDRQVGSLFPRKNKKGKTYLSGNFKLKNFGYDKEINISIVKNNFRKKDNHPTHYIRVQEDSLHHLRIPLEPQRDEFLEGDGVNKGYDFVKDMEQDENDLPDFDEF